MSKIPDESVEDVLSAVTEAGFSSSYRLDEMLRLYTVIISRATNSNPPKTDRNVMSSVEQDVGVIENLQVASGVETKDDLIKWMATRFLNWKLPDDFAPDCGISFKRESDYEHPIYGRHKYEPVGTNLFHAGQAEDMVRYMFGYMLGISSTKTERNVEYGNSSPKSERLTTDPTDPALGRGVDTEPVPQNEKYLVLSEEERAQGFVNPVRTTYRHVGKQITNPIRELTESERDIDGGEYVAFEVYPESMKPKTGRYWTQRELDNRGCGTTTTMGDAIAETYARNPKFYGSTYCVHCSKHLPVEEFVWEDGTRVGSLHSENN